jgi:hypothetical protein
MEDVEGLDEQQYPRISSGRSDLFTFRKDVQSGRSFLRVANKALVTKVFQGWKKCYLNSPIHYMHYDAMKLRRELNDRWIGTVFAAWKFVCTESDFNLENLLSNFRLRQHYNMFYTFIRHTTELME